MSLLILMTYYEDLIMLKNSFIKQDEHNEKLLNMYSLQLATDWLHRNTTWLAFIAKTICTIFSLQHCDWCQQHHMISINIITTWLSCIATYICNINVVYSNTIWFSYNHINNLLINETSTNITQRKPHIFTK